MGFCFNHRKQSSSLPSTKSDKISDTHQNKSILRKNVKQSTSKLSARDRIFLQSIGLKVKP